MQEFEEKLLKGIKHYYRNLSKQTTKLIVDALNDSVMNFNEVMVQQFGENFAKLDESANALLVWQDQYKTTLESLHNRYHSTAGILTEVKDSVLDIENSISRLPALVQDFEKLLKFNDHQIGKIGEEMLIFADIKDKALSTFPEVRRQFSLMADEVKKTTIDLNKLLEANSLAATEKLTKVSEIVAQDVELNAILIKQTNEEAGKLLLKTTQDLNVAINALEESLVQQFAQFQLNFSKVAEEVTKQQVQEFRNAIKTPTYVAKEVNVGKPIESVKTTVGLSQSTNNKNNQQSSDSESHGTQTQVSQAESKAEDKSKSFFGRFFG